MEINPSNSQLPLWCGEKRKCLQVQRSTISKKKSKDWKMCLSKHRRTFMNTREWTDCLCNLRLNSHKLIVHQCSYQCCSLHAHFTHTLTHDALIKGAFQCFKRKKIKRKDKRGESLRSLEENLTYSSNSAQSGFGSFKSFDPFFLLVHSFVPCP